jgi:hypothetical protein
MASIAFVVTMNDGAQMTKTAELTDEQVGRLITWGLATFSDQNDDYGNPIPRTVPWMLERWIQDVVGSAFIAVQNYEKQVAAERAMNSVELITVDII